MIIITGAGGFIGSVVLGYLNKQGFKDIYIFDDLPESTQFKNLVGKQFHGIHSVREIPNQPNGIECIIHIGAISSTLEKDWNKLYVNNVVSTREWYLFSLKHKIPFIFTSSAAVYGNGDGPLNQYAFSKQTVEGQLEEAVILRLFNVYGPNEYHKGRMASTIFHWWNQLTSTGKLKIFENSEKFKRDFVYVEDVAKVIYHFVKNHKKGIYDVGTGTSVSFETVANSCLKHDSGWSKEYIPMPDDLKAQYQANTCADLQPLKDAGFDVSQLRSVYQGVDDYVEYLKFNKFY